MEVCPSKIYLLLCRLWFYDCLRSGTSKLRPASQIRPATPFHPAREEILLIMKK